jgi:hypothetical protein
MTNQPASLRHTTWHQIQGACSILVKLGEDLEYLRTGDESHLGYDIKMASWGVYWNELIAEMKTVEASCSSAIRYSGVYVLTTWPYTDFLRLLAGKLSDCMPLVGPIQDNVEFAAGKIAEKLISVDHGLLHFPSTMLSSAVEFSL